MSSHTPGPWYVAGGNSLRVWHRVMVGRTTEKQTIASVNEALTEPMANARLIAAAPDLLAALKGMLDQPETTEAYDASLQRAIDAIAKAEAK